MATHPGNGRPVDILSLIEASAHILSETDESGIVLSSRLRLARNFRGVRFPGRASPSERQQVLELVRASLTPLADSIGLQYLDFSALSPLEQEALVECHVISRGLVTASGQRALAITPDARLSAMLHEEDHIRLQAITGGLSLEAGLAQARLLEEELGRARPFAFRPGLGFLTACPSNVGTGLRASVMLRLSALFFLNKLDLALKKRVRQGMAVRGLYGEGSPATACLLQISNQVTAGVSETDLVGRVRECAQGLIEDEERARRQFLHHHLIELEDLVHRALGTLQSARMISSEEAMERLTQIRLGVDLGILDGPPTCQLDRLLVLVRPATLQLVAGRQMTERERDAHRADMIAKAVAEPPVG